MAVEFDYEASCPKIFTDCSAYIPAEDPYEVGDCRFNSGRSCARELATCETVSATDLNPESEFEETEPTDAPPDWFE